MARSLGYGIIGCGMMGQEHIRNIALLGDAHVAAIHEPDPAMRSAAQALAPSARIVDSVAELLAIEDLDCVLIASPNFLHVDQLETVAQWRPVPVLVEKPLCIARPEIARITDLARRLPLVWVAMEYRYMPPIAALVRDAGATTGGIRMLTIREHRYPFLPKVGHWNRFNRLTGGTFVEKCCHFFDLMRLILKDDPVQVMASAGQAVNHTDENYDGQVPDVWDNGYVLVDFAGGARAMLELCMFAEGSRYQEEISAVGPAGKIECFAPGPSRFWPANLGERPVARVIRSPRIPAGPRVTDVAVPPELLAVGDHNGATFFQHRRFVDAVRTGGAPDVGVSDGIWATVIGLAAQLSAQERRAVRIADEFPVHDLVRAEEPCRMHGA